MCMGHDFPLQKIIHVDMDAFYASVEQMDNPLLKGMPIAVGGGESRGVVAAASYEARTFGVRSAMSGHLAKMKCPPLIFIKPRFQRYKEISLRIRDIFLEYTDLVEPLSLDEAYLDVTQNKKGNPSATLIASEIRHRIFKEVGLTASAGISINKFIAKVASDYNKPNGQKTVNPEAVPEFLENLDIRKFHGVGKVTAEKMYRLGIFTGADLKTRSQTYLEAHFGKNGSYYFDVVRGIHNSEVQPNSPPKSIGAERTFDENISSELFMTNRLELIAKELVLRLQKANIAGKTLTLKIKYSDFTLQTRSRTLPYFIADQTVILEMAKNLLYQEKIENSVRLLGLSLTNLNVENKNPEREKSVLVQLKFDL